MTIDLREPIGRFVYTEKFTPAKRAELIAELENYPNRLKEAVAGLSDSQLDQSYREGGWTIRQLVHHIADTNAHFNNRFRHALTEPKFNASAFDENEWAELADGKSAPIVPSLLMLAGIHARWVILLKSLTDSDFDKTFVHPRYGELSLDRALGMNTWHSLHHLAQITGLRARKGW